MVLPQIPKLSPENRRMAHAKKEMPMHRVFPLRTAPSQMMASLSRWGELSHHQVSTWVCRGESRLTFMASLRLILQGAIKILRPIGIPLLR
jgi:hypothetical protein